MNGFVSYFFSSADLLSYHLLPHLTEDMRDVGHLSMVNRFLRKVLEDRCEALRLLKKGDKMAILVNGNLDAIQYSFRHKMSDSARIMFFVTTCVYNHINVLKWWIQKEGWYHLYRHLKAADYISVKIIQEFILPFDPELAVICSINSMRTCGVVQNKTEILRLSFVKCQPAHICAVAYYFSYPLPMSKHLQNVILSTLSTIQQTIWNTEFNRI